MARQKQTTAKPKPKRQIDPEPFPNDWLEATIIVVVLATMAGGAYFMYLLSQA